MMRVKVGLGLSGIHGIGVFAMEPIPKNTLIWSFTPGFDMEFTREEFSKLPLQAREFLATYAYRSKKSKLYVLCMDHAKHFNHSDHPNTSNRYEIGEREVITRASRDILAGEELTCNYSEFEEAGDHGIQQKRAST